MQLRKTTIKQRGKTYRYSQLVESYRREKDGMPAKRVLANLGQLSDDEHNNLKTAIDASRKGKRVVLSSLRAVPQKPQANLAYLDIAVLLELWKRLGLDLLANTLLKDGQADVRPADVVAALSIHRCVDPNSKLHATRWFARTALPELLDIDSRAFNNTRLHRVLEQVSKQTGIIMRALPALYLGHSNTRFSAIYTDITDALFEGNGPSLACRGRAKDDVIRQRIGIVLVCNQNGYPLRWEVIAGNAPEAPALLRHMRAAAETDWGKEVTIAADRAIGNTSHIQELLSAGVQFVTAISRTEFQSYAPEVTDLATNKLADKDAKETVDILEQHGFNPIRDDLWIRDLGVITPGTCNDSDEPSQQNEELSPLDPARDALQRAMDIEHALQTGLASSRDQAARILGYQFSTSKTWCLLLRLTSELKNKLLDGAGHGLALRKMVEVAKLKPEDQCAAFDTLVRLRDEGILPRCSRQRRTKTTTAEESHPVRVRAVVCFNPDILEHRRKKAQETLDDLYAFVDKLNSKADQSTTRSGLRIAVDRKLRHFKLLNVFAVSTTTRGQSSIPQVQLQMKEAVWRKRRALDGLAVLVAHPNVRHSAVELNEIYRGKDAVEKDFQTIKSVLRMMPVRHHTDNKVLAHVTICVLALLLERFLREELKGLMTAEEALETLQVSQLNRYGTPQSRAYLVTELDELQKKILRTLKLEHLGNDEAMIEMIHQK